MKTMIEEVADVILTEQSYDANNDEKRLACRNISRYLNVFQEIGYGEFTINEILREVPPPEQVAA